MPNEFDVYKERRYLCCICGLSFLGYGNNPFPYREKGECCGQCNMKFVVPARIELSRKQKEN